MPRQKIKNIKNNNETKKIKTITTKKKPFQSIKITQIT